MQVSSLAFSLTKSKRLRYIFSAYYLLCRAGYLFPKLTTLLLTKYFFIKFCITKLSKCSQFSHIFRINLFMFHFNTIEQPKN